MDKFQNHHRGQGLIEVLISVGIIMLILGGVVPLMLISLSSKSKTFERKTMVEVAEKKLEEIVNEKQNDESEFWAKVPSDIGDSDTDVYRYRIIYTENTDVGCTDARPYNCANVTVKVSLLKDLTKIVTFSRFFAKN